MSKVALLVVLAATAVALPAASASTVDGDAAASRFKPTHRVSISGTYVDHWTIDDPTECGPVGDGTVTVKFRQVTAAKVQVSYTRERRWVVLAPYPRTGQITFLGYRPVTGSVTLVDNTVPRTPPDYDCEGALDKSGCGAVPLRRPSAQIYADVGDRRRMKVNMSSRDFRPVTGGCWVGGAENFSQPPRLVGGVDGGRVPVTMPRPSAFFRRQKVTVTGKTHRRTSLPRDGNDAASSDEITRTVTVTFTRLRR